MVGDCPSTPTGSEITIWDNCTKYTYLTADTDLFISSSSASDTAVTVSIIGLDDTYTEITRTVTVGGQSQVQISGQMFRIYEMSVNGSTAPVGDLYLAETDTLTDGVPDTSSKVKAKIRLDAFGNTHGATQMALYTVPAGKIAQPIRFAQTTGKGNDGLLTPKLRPLGGIFRTLSEFELYQQTNEFGIAGLIFPEKSDFEISTSTLNAGSKITASVDFLVKDN